MQNKLKYYILIISVAFFFSYTKAENKIFYNSDTIKIYEQTFDTLVETLPGFEKPIGFSNGHWNVLYINKKIKEDFYIKEGHLNGLYKQYWPNGKIMYEGYFNNEGNIKKYWNVYDNAGELAKQFIYKNGVKNIETMYSNRKVSQIIYYGKDGVSVKKIIHKDK